VPVAEIDHADVQLGLALAFGRAEFPGGLVAVHLESGLRAVGAEVRDHHEAAQERRHFHAGVETVCVDERGRRRPLRVADLEVREDEPGRPAPTERNAVDLDLAVQRVADPRLEPALAPLRLGDEHHRPQRHEGQQQDDDDDDERDSGRTCHADFPRPLRVRACAGSSGTPYPVLRNAM
jgi:hypothetical protein